MSENSLEMKSAAFEISGLKACLPFMLSSLRVLMIRATLCSETLGFWLQEVRKIPKKVATNNIGK
jgi:hypothetical protein